MLGTLAAEWLKARKRPAVWISLAIAFALLVGLGYVLLYFLYTYSRPPTGPGAPRLDYALLKQVVYPSHYHQNTISGGAVLGGVLAMIIGVLLQGSEYGWGTVKTAFTQRASRVEVIGARLAVMSGVMLIQAAGMLALGAVGSAVAAAVDGKLASYPYPAPLTQVKALVALWLVYLMWSSFGFALATLFRQSALAIGLGLAYALVIEQLIFGIGDSVGGDAVRAIHQWFPIQNASFLLGSFGTGVPVEATGRGAAKPFADATHGAVVLIVYCLGFAATSLALTQRRDVTG